MKTHIESMRTICAALALFVAVSAMSFIAHATPPSGISFSPVGRATLPEFDVARKFRLEEPGEFADRFREEVLEA